MKKLLNRFKFAFVGLRAVFSEQAFRLGCFSAVLVVILMIVLGLTSQEKAILILAIVVVLSLEILNSRIEKVLDIVQPNFDERVKIIKDISAGAVLVSVIGSLIIGILIFYPYLIKILNQF